MTVRSYRTLKEKLYSGAIRTGVEEVGSSQSCPSSGTYTRIVYSYDPSTCAFGKVKRASQEHNLIYSSSTGKYTRTTGSWVNYGSCGTY